MSARLRSPSPALRRYEAVRPMSSSLPMPAAASGSGTTSHRPRARSPSWAAVAYAAAARASRIACIVAGNARARVVRAEPVVGDLGGEAPGARGGRRLVRLGVARVEPGALAGQQVGEDRLAHERVAERVVVALDREHAEVDALARRRVELVVGAAVDLRRACACETRTPPVEMSRSSSCADSGSRS